MADPFQDVDAAGEEFIAAFADTMDARQSDPKMESIVASYLSKLKFAEGSLTVEVGAGAGGCGACSCCRAHGGKSHVAGRGPAHGSTWHGTTRHGYTLV